VGRCSPRRAGCNSTAEAPGVRRPARQDVVEQLDEPAGEHFFVGMREIIFGRRAVIEAIRGRVLTLWELYP
jgi:hypothetical protein